MRLRRELLQRLEEQDEAPADGLLILPDDHHAGRAGLAKEDGLVRRYPFAARLAHLLRPDLDPTGLDAHPDLVEAEELRAILEGVPPYQPEQ